MYKLQENVLQNFTRKRKFIADSYRRKWQVQNPKKKPMEFRIENNKTQQAY